MCASCQAPRPAPHPAHMHISAAWRAVEAADMCIRATGNWSFESAGCWALVPAVVGAGGVDQAAYDGDRGGQEEEELDDGALLVGAAAQLAVAEPPRVQWRLGCAASRCSRSVF